MKDLKKLKMGFIILVQFSMNASVLIHFNVARTKMSKVLL